MQKTRKLEAAYAKGSGYTQSVAHLITEDRIYKMALRGHSLTGVAKALGVARSVLYKYLKDQPELRTAYEKGREQDTLEVVQALRNNAIEKNNVIAQIFYLKNRDPENWQDKQDVKHSGNLTINVSGFSKPLHNDADSDDIIEHEPMD